MSDAEPLTILAALLQLCSRQERKIAQFEQDLAMIQKANDYLLVENRKLEAAKDVLIARYVPNDAADKERTQ